jgi:predicted phosphodiesterase/translation initiation factor 1 (eIF-1/SUI1)
MPGIELEIDDDVFSSRQKPFNSFLAALRNTKSRKLATGGVLLLICSVFLWVTFLAPSVSSFNSDDSDENIPAASRHPQFRDLVLVKTLDPSLLPRSSKDKTEVGSGKKRLLFVGDIHGCKKELEALLKKAKFNPVHDHLVAAGDVVTKGPDSPGVVDLLRKYGASCVRGNHDDEILAIAHRLRSKEAESSDDAVEAGRLDAVHKLAKSLGDKHLEYLQSCPIILRIGELKAFSGEAVVVHAGLVPGQSLESQDPFAAMNMRIIDTSTNIPSENHNAKGSTDWYKLWNKNPRLSPTYDQLARSETESRRSAKPVTVIYGHNARKGLQLHKHTKGLDTACARGGKLTALVVDGDGKQEVIQVKSKQHH